MDSINHNLKHAQAQGVRITAADFFRLPDDCRRIEEGKPEVLISDSTKNIFAKAIITH